MAIGIIAAIATIAGTGYSVYQGRQAERANRRAAGIEQRRAAIQNARERRRMAAQSQIQQAQVQASAAAADGGTTTGTATAVGAIQSQTAGAISFQRDQANMFSQIQSQQRRASEAQGRAATGQAIANLPGQLGFGLGDIIRTRG